ncbi:hypothetical protein BC629DRAFT_1437845 [Irpex lacteus]|nr:hypothetical protein BC629DRAFT_1437845 [Irpex lacteus]
MTIVRKWVYFDLKVAFLGTYLASGSVITLPSRSSKRKRCSLTYLTDMGASEEIGKYDLCPMIDEVSERHATCVPSAYHRVLHAVACLRYAAGNITSRRVEPPA